MKSRQHSKNSILGRLRKGTTTIFDYILLMASSFKGPVPLEYSLVFLGSLDEINIDGSDSGMTHDDSYD